MSSQTYSRKSTPPSQTHNKEYKVIGKSNSIWKPYKKLYSANGETYCPNCQQQLLKSETIIPIGENSNLLVKGLVCPKCKSMFVKDTDKISKILKDNIYSVGFYLNDIAYWQFTELKRKRKLEKRKQKIAEEKLIKKEAQRKRSKYIFKSIESSAVLISVKFNDKSEAEYIIITQKNSVSAENTIHYASPTGLELLAAAYVPARKRRGVLNGQNYRVISAFKNVDLLETIIPSTVKIKTDGGYSSSVKNRNHEIIDLLLYSPYKKTYECVHATHDKEDNICFMDISIYRGFVKRFGNPGLQLSFPMSASAKMGELNEESILRGYGYTVAKSENLSSDERKDLLAEIVDLDILTVARIVHHLDFCISLHAAPQYEDAKDKWASDKAFIENYKVNPARFMLQKIL